uniref:Dual serine/threonine and tyrosine protein kinase n=1 Tax=Plectus sambesii TaxID=2011161 RepID=A0A914ULV0_9BILA
MYYTNLVMVKESDDNNFYEENNKSNWRPIVIRYGTSGQCRLIASSSDEVDCLSELTLSSISASVSAVPISALAMDSWNTNEYLEVSLMHALLKDGADLIVPSFGKSPTGEKGFLLDRWMQKCLPLLIYVISTPTLGDEDYRHISRVRQRYPESPIFFIHSQLDLPEAERHLSSSPQWSDRDLPPLMTQHSLDDSASDLTAIADSWCDDKQSALRQRMIECGILSMTGLRRCSSMRKDRSSTATLSPTQMEAPAMVPGCDLIDSLAELPRLVAFVKAVSHARLVELATQCNIWHNGLLNLFILTAFDMARDQLITPRRMEYSKEQEMRLFNELLAVTQHKQDELQTLFSTTLDALRADIENAAAELSYREVNGKTPSVTEATDQLEQLVLFKVNSAVADRLTASLQCLRQTCVGTLSRCLQSLEEYTGSVDSPTARDSNSEECAKQQLVASKALKDMLNAAYSVELGIPSGDGLFKLLLRKLSQVSARVASSCFHSLLPCLPPPSAAFSDDESDMEEMKDIDSCVALTCAHNKENSRSWHDAAVDGALLSTVIAGANGSKSDAPNDAAWRRNIASGTLERLARVKLAKVLCTQFRTRIKTSHDVFLSALDKLDNYHNTRLMKAENQRLKLRKQHAPKLARLTMESLAHRDSLAYGMPKLGAEVGRGQYGVVYSCEKWGVFGQCAVKSVIPPDDKHWNDLALEFYYTKSLPEHRHIVKLHGAVIDHGYGGGGGPPAVLLIMERMKRDLYAAIRAGLDWPQRLQVTLDVVDGIRFLHSQGLVHRDIKLKNVLLDDDNRGKITDLGFCKPEAMMSGSVVGTPIHMAPELFSGSYDASVDVYAFGVLFWYICAGHVRLPQAFEQCMNKDQLWHSVRKGLRPEQLSTFDSECWSIMRDCWSGDAMSRPHLGDIQPRIQMLLDQYNAHNKDMMPNVNSAEAKARSDQVLLNSRLPVRSRPRPSFFN